MGETGDRSERAQRAFDHAVAGEWKAIAVHERAAQLHEAASELWAQTALTTLDPGTAARLTERAANERRLAATALERARTALARLVAEGAGDSE